MYYFSLSIIFITFFLHSAGWICNSIHISSKASFDYEHPPIIIAHIKAPSTNNEQGHGKKNAQLHDMERTIKIDSFK
jgi:hypothetical protein